MPLIAIANVVVGSGTKAIREAMGDWGGIQAYVT